MTETADEHVTQGQTIVQDTESAIESLSQEVNHSAEIINQLAKNSSEIGGFVDVIREIADQTNLLALKCCY